MTSQEVGGLMMNVPVASTLLLLMMAPCMEKMLTVTVLQMNGMMMTMETSDSATDTLVMIVEMMVGMFVPTFMRMAQVISQTLGEIGLNGLSTGHAMVHL